MWWVNFSGLILEIAGAIILSLGAVEPLKKANIERTNRESRKKQSLEDLEKKLEKEAVTRVEKGIAPREIKLEQAARDREAEKPMHNPMQSSHDTFVLFENLFRAEKRAGIFIGVGLAFQGTSAILEKCI